VTQPSTTPAADQPASGNTNTAEGLFKKITIFFILIIYKLLYLFVFLLS